MTNDELVGRIRTQVAAGLDPGAMLNVYADRARRGALHERIKRAAGTDLTEAEVAALAAQLFGFGILQPLLDDATITDVLVNSTDEVFVDGAAGLVRTELRFESAAQVADLAHRIAAGVGRELTLERPYVDARMRDGSRANAVIAPIGGPTLSIRKFSRVSLPLRGPASSWTSTGGLTDAGAELLAQAVSARANILIVGATGSGKSTLLRSLAREIPSDERIIVVEDTNELELPHPHVVHLEAQAARESPIGTADLVANALRMRPDRIIVGEVRTPREASALLDALTTGHDGSITTAHAGSARGAIDRLEVLLLRAGEAAPTAVRTHILGAFDVIVHLVRRGSLRMVDEIALIDEGALRLAQVHHRQSIALPSKLGRRLV